MELIYNMNLEIYQAYYSQEHIEHLDSAFIPFDNSLGDKSLLEYSMWCSIKETITSSNTYWGVLSWRWDEKTKLEGGYFKHWILNNPGYDVYSYNPCLFLVEDHNVWVQGERDCPGIVNYANILLNKLGYNFDIRNFESTGDQLYSCHYFIGSNKFWDRYLNFLKEVIEISKNDIVLNEYMFISTRIHRGKDLIYFPFIIERLFTLFCMLNPDIQVKNYPYESFGFKDTYKNSFEDYFKNSYYGKYNESRYYHYLLDIYYNRKRREAEILNNQQQLLNNKLQLE